MKHPQSLSESRRIPLETAHQFLSTFGITTPTKTYERWVKDDGFDSADFRDVLAESPFVFRIDWKASLPDELPLIADALAKLEVELTIDVEPDADSGFVVCNGRQAKVNFVASDNDDDFTQVIVTIQSVVPDSIEFRASPDNAGSDTWEYAVLPRDEWAALEKLDRGLVNSLFEPLETDTDLARFFSQRGLGVISTARAVPLPDKREAEFLEAASRHAIDEVISLAVPDDWQIWEPSDDDLFVAAAPEKGRDEIQPHFVATKQPTRWDSSHGYMIGSVVGLRNLDGYVEHEIFEFECGGSRIACVSFDAPDGQWLLTNRQYMFVMNDWAYLIACKMLPEQARRWSGVFDNIVRSLQLTGHDD